MKKLLLTLAFLLVSPAAWAQCNGVFPATTICGNLGPGPAPPHAISAATSVFGPSSSIIGDLPYWTNLTGTGLGDTGVPIFPITTYGAPCNGTGDDYPAIISAITSAAVAAEGEQAKVLLCRNVHTNEPIVETQSNVKLVGLGSGFNSGNCNNAGTTWTWGGPASGVIFTLETSANVVTSTGLNGGLEGACLNGGGTAGIGVETISRLGFRYYNLSFTGFTSQAMFYTTQATSAQTFGNQVGDVSYIYCAATGSAVCLSLDGVFGFGNTSINDWNNFTLSTVNGNCIEFHNADSNIIRHARCASTGTGTVEFFGSATNGAEANYNIIEGLSDNNPALFDNLSAFPSLHNSIFWLDSANGNPIPNLTGGGTVVNPYGTYSYDYGFLQFINGCPTPYSGSNSLLNIGCGLEVNGTTWSYFSYNANGVVPNPNTGIFALADNFTGFAEVDEYNTFPNATGKSFQHFQNTGAISSYLLDTLATSGYTVNGTITTSGYTIANLELCASGSQGAHAYVTNAPSPIAYNGLVSSGSTSNYIAPIFCDGTNWRYH